MASWNYSHMSVSQPVRSPQNMQRVTMYWLFTLLGLAVLGMSLLGIRPSATSAASNIQISAGNAHTCVLANGGVKCWGRGYSGQLGNGTRADSYKPQATSGVTNATTISCGSVHTCAIVNGGVKCWGDNGNNKLGISATDALSLTYISSVMGLTTTLSLIPLSVNELQSNVTTLSMGSEHNCVLMNGGARCWGSNNHGQLGNGTTNAVSITTIPMSVSGLISNVTTITTGRLAHTCALVKGGVKCWGYNMYGQLGNGTRNDSSTPVDVTGLVSNVTAIATGFAHTCAVVNGGVKCWGWNMDGQLGDGTKLDSSTPVDVSGLESGSGVTALAVGSSHTCAIVKGGVKCWGFAYMGQTGDGVVLDSNGISLTNRLTPVSVSGLTSGVTTIAAGDYHTCAVVQGGVKCWGSNQFGQIGDGTTINRLTPVDVTSKISLKQETTILTHTGSYDFGLNDIGSSKVSTFTIANQDTTDLNLTGSPKVIVAGTAFSLTQDATSPVGPGMSTTFKVAFMPHVTGLQTATVTIVSDDSLNQNYILYLKGMGSGSIITVTRTPVLTPTVTLPVLTPTVTLPVLTPTVTLPVLTPTVTLPVLTPTVVLTTTAGRATLTPTQSVYLGLTPTLTWTPILSRTATVTATQTPAVGKTLTPISILTPTPTQRSNLTPTPTFTPTSVATLTPSPIPPRTANCWCPLVWLTGGCTSSIVATLAQSSTLDINTFYQVRAILSKGSTGQKYIAIYEQHGSEVTDLLVADSALRAKALQTLTLWQPTLQALTTGQGASALITADLANTMESFMQDLIAKGSPALQQALQTILTENPPGQLVGKTIAQVQEQVAPAGWQVYLPLITR